MSSLADAISGDLAGWSGLSGDLDPLALEAVLGVQWTPDPASRSRAASAFTVLHGRRVDAWLRVGETEVTSLEFPAPESLDHAAVLAGLGEPETVLRSNHFEVGAVVAGPRPRRAPHHRGGSPSRSAEDRRRAPVDRLRAALPADDRAAYVTDRRAERRRARPSPRPPAA